MLIKQRDTMGAVYFLDVQLPSPNVSNRFGLQLAAAPSKMLTASIAATLFDASVVQTSDSVSVTENAWFKVSFELRPTLPRVTVRIDGVAFMDRTSLPQATPTTSQSFQLGPGTGPVTSPWIVLFDDVVCDLIP